MMTRNKNAALYEAEAIAVIIGKCAWKAMLEEVYTTPKPGLVDLYSNGAHTDMDVHTFEKSANALYPYFVQMALQGYFLNCTPEILFQEIRKTGQLAENAMYQATDGVNTHKGIIFTIGIFCAAAGRCIRENSCLTAETLSDMQKKMTTRILIEELETCCRKNAVSNGEKNLQQYGTLGIRGEAVLGYPGIWQTAFPVLRAGKSQERNWNKVKLQTLLTLMSKIEDSNILARQNPHILSQVQQESSEFLKNGGAYADWSIRKLLQMDEEFTQKNISAGGCADLLAATIFIDELLEYRW